MGVPTIFLGYIEEAWPGNVGDGGPGAKEHLRALTAEIARHNEAALKALPPEDEFPPLCRPMFGWPPAGSQITYQNRIIHFAACMKNVEFCLREWVDKFEQLLRR